MINSPRVCIQVQSVYIEAQSSPDDERYVFAYTVTIRNLGRAPVQLLGRYWLITNGHGRETEVQGKVWLAFSRTLNLVKSTSIPAVPLSKRRWARCRVITK